MREYITLRRGVFSNFADLTDFDAQKGMSIWTVWGHKRPLVGFSSRDATARLSSAGPASDRS